jgi:hypothetical protein
MNFQITPAPTKEIAIGINISDFTIDSYLTLSNNIAIISPKKTVRGTKNAIHKALFRKEISIVSLVKQ